MSVLIGLLLAAVVGVMLLRRRRASVLAGRDSARPTYQVAPPTRRVGSRNDWRMR